MNQKKPFIATGRILVTVLSAGIVSMTLIGCPADEQAELPNLHECVSNEDFFREDVWNPILSSSCYACHNPQGQAHHTEMVFQNSNQPNYLLNNMQIAENIASFEKDGVSLLLLKPSGAIDHGGGEVLTKDSAEYKALEEFVERSGTPIRCADSDTDNFWAGVQMLDDQAALRKATLLLTGRLPSEEEYALVEEDPDAGLETVLYQMMEEPEFRDFVVGVFNDMFMTERYVGGNRATDLLDDDDYPNNRFYSDLDEEEHDEEYIDLAQDYTNDAVARAPLHLVSYLIENDLPFTEILTADYMMVNPFSAIVYGIDDVSFDNPQDPWEFRPGRISGVPHAGVLTSPMWLNRFPTTDTNRNRHRARMVYDFFLATDIMKLAERPVDPTSIVDFNPTMYNPQCSVCHSNIDPIAGAFQNWDAAGRYRPPEEGWHSDMRPPGFKEGTIPTGEWGNSLQWLGHLVSEDPLFAVAITRNLFKGMTGKKVLFPPAPEVSEEEGRVQQLAFDAQDEILQKAALEFIDSNYNIKAIVASLIQSNDFRASGVASLSDDRSAELANMGTARFLTPELLHKKIESISGYSWTTNNNRDYLLSESEYLIFYGGINFDDITRRITLPNGLMASVAMRMANEVSCEAGPRDFTRTGDDRILFPYVERSFEPEDSNGFEIDGAVTAIKENIQYLHARILGETLPLDHEEIFRSYQIFYETWKEGKTQVANNEVSRDLPGNCRVENDLETGESLPEELRVRSDQNYTVRAWMAVLTYLFSDFRFLHE